eukprot:9648417-Prorocentrum_lima.AAC.1
MCIRDRPGTPIRQYSTLEELLCTTDPYHADYDLNPPHQGASSSNAIAHDTPNVNPPPPKPTTRDQITQTNASTRTKRIQTETQPTYDT